MVRQSQPHYKNVGYFASAVERQVVAMGNTGNVRNESLERAKIEENDWSCIGKPYKETVGSQAKGTERRHK